MRYFVLLFLLTSRLYSEPLYFEVDSAESSELCSPYAYRYTDEREAGSWHSLSFFDYDDSFLRVYVNVDGYMGEETEERVVRRVESSSLYFDEQSDVAYYERKTVVNNHRGRATILNSLHARIEQSQRLTAELKIKSKTFRCAYILREWHNH